MEFESHQSNKDFEQKSDLPSKKIVKLGWQSALENQNSSHLQFHRGPKNTRLLNSTPLRHPSQLRVHRRTILHLLLHRHLQKSD